MSEEPDAPAPAAAPPRVDAPAPLAPHEHFRVLESIKDNLEAFTIALIMALVIKHFCVEAFKIPTGSMEPTLLGEKNNPVGDRILVDKLAYLTHGPQRWDVVVFRFPLNQSKHFIKRVAGVGGEYLRILRGDLWVRSSKDEPWRIATKPRRVREELYLPVFPVEGQPGTDPETFWRPDGAWSVRSQDRLRFEGGEAAGIELLKKVGRLSSNGWEGVHASGSLVRDVRFRLRARPEGRSTLTLVWRTANDEEAFVRLAAPDEGEGAVAGIRHPGRSAREALPAVWGPDRSVDVELECVDGRVHVHLDGAEVATFEEPRTIGSDRELGDFTQSFTLQAEGAPVAIEHFRVDRDLHYERSSDMDVLEEGTDGMWIEPDTYFMLGDNTGSSSDSRKWKLYDVPLTDGRHVIYNFDHDDGPRREGDTLVVVDRDGIERRWRNEDVATPPGRQVVREPFVPRDLIVGRAFLVFWPVLPDPPGRFGFIR